MFSVTYLELITTAKTTCLSPRSRLVWKVKDNFSLVVYMAVLIKSKLYSRTELPVKLPVASVMVNIIHLYTYTQLFIINKQIT